MDVSHFKNNFSHKLINYKLTYSSYPDGDFGYLERVVIEGPDKVAGIDFWSRGWLDIDVYDLVLDQQVMNVLIEPAETQKKEQELIKFMRILLDGG